MQGMATLPLAHGARVCYNTVMTQSSNQGVYIGFLSGNQLKIIACITMLIDHIGWILLPDIAVLRIIGRISMPLFAFTFGEGCFYTRRKGAHFAAVLLLGLVTSAAMSYVMGRPYGNILITYSFSCLVIYSLEWLKRSAFGRRGSYIALSSAALVLSLAAAVWLCCFSLVDVDYGIAGVLLPVCVRLFDFRSYGAAAGSLLAECYNLATVLLPFLICLVALSAIYGATQAFGLISLLFIMAYSGRRGKRKLKALFYIFYPAHLMLLAGIYLILDPSYLTTLF